MNRLPLALLLGALIAPYHAVAQITADPDLLRTLSTLKDSAHVRLLAPGVLLEDGYFLGLRLDSVRVASADAVVTVGLDEIEGMSVEGSRWKSLAIQSGVVATVVGATAGFFLGYAACGDQLKGCDEHAWRVSVRWGLVFGVGGAVLGGAVGSRMRTWRTVFP